jgi:tripeptide aminopeptidase
VAFFAHVDTAPDFSGANVKPIVHRQWNGRPFKLPDDLSLVFNVKTDPELAEAIGKNLITTSGKSLLGADDKAGVAIIMTLAQHLLQHPEIPHGPLRVCFVPDEEVGLLGASSLDLDKLGAHVGYTLDDHGTGFVVYETFSGDSAVVTIQGVATHPGEARKHKMLNAVHLAGKLLASLPREFVSPETTEDHQGYLHPVTIEGNGAQTTIHFILRDFNDKGLADKRRRLTGLCQGFQASEPRSKITCTFAKSYRNMAEILKHDMRPVELAIEATQAQGIKPNSPPVRGGTDGSVLSQRGLPTPNLSCGGHKAHGPMEWVALQDMVTALNISVDLVQLWAQKGQGYKGFIKP